jgi:hypothetical protein
MQRTTDFHDHIANPSFPYLDGFFAHAAALDTAADMLDAHAPPSKLPIPRFLGLRQLVPAGLLRGSEDVHAVECEYLKAQLLPQLTPHRQGIRRGIGDALVMDTARMRLAQVEEKHGSSSSSIGDSIMRSAPIAA